MFVQLLVGAFKCHPLSEPIDDHGEHQTDQGPKPNLVRRGHYEIQRNGALVTNQITDGEVTGRGVPGYQGIAVNRQRRLRRRKHSTEILVLFVEHLLHFFPNRWMSAGRASIGHLPVVLAFNVVDEVEQVVKGLAEAGPRPREHVGQIAQTGDSFGCRGGIANMQDHAGRDRRCGVLPVTFLRRILAGAHDHVGDVLCV